MSVRCVHGPFTSRSGAWVPAAHEHHTPSRAAAPCRGRDRPGRRLIAPLELRSSADPNAYGNAIAEYEQFYGLGVDGLFADNPDTAVEAR
jgi:hypothetical protein